MTVSWVEPKPAGRIAFGDQPFGGPTGIQVIAVFGQSQGRIGGSLDGGGTAAGWAPASSYRRAEGLSG